MLDCIKIIVISTDEPILRAERTIISIFEFFPLCGDLHCYKIVCNIFYIVSAILILCLCILLELFVINVDRKNALNFIQSKHKIYHCVATSQAIATVLTEIEDKIHTVHVNTNVCVHTLLNNFVKQYCLISAD